jgi:uncharacterized protein (DUF4415 family)
MTKMQKSRRPKPPKTYDENPPLSAAQLRKARPASDVVPQIVADAKRGPGRPKIENAKVPISLRLDPTIIEAYKATGEGWQGRMSAALAKGAPKLPRRSGIGGVTLKGSSKSPRFKSLSGEVSYVIQGPKHAEAGRGAIEAEKLIRRR